MLALYMWILIENPEVWILIELLLWFIIAFVAVPVLAIVPSIFVVPSGKWMPNEIRRFKRIWLIASIPIPLVILLKWLPSFASTPEHALYLGASIVPGLLYKRWIGRSWLFRNALWSDHGACPVCGYDLRGRKKTVTCPECGADVSDEARRKAIES